MKNLVKAGIGLAVGIAAASSQAMPVVIGFGGQAASDGSGLTSSQIAADNVSLNPGWFIETFDKQTYVPLPNLANPEFVGLTGIEGTSGTSDASLIGDDVEIFQNSTIEGNQCSFNGFGGPVVSTTGGGFGISGQSISGAAAPLNDGTCFGYTPATTGATSGTVTIDYQPLVAAGVLEGGLGYLGFYYGSIDDYNDFTFFSGETQVAKILGQEIVDLFDAKSGDQQDPDTNQYVNIFFDAGTSFTKFTVNSDGRAAEFDNIVVGKASIVPAPATLALFSLGLLGLASFGRRGKKQG